MGSFQHRAPTCRIAKILFASPPDRAGPARRHRADHPAGTRGPPTAKALVRTTYVGLDAAVRTWLNDQPGLPSARWQLGEG